LSLPYAGTQLEMVIVLPVSDTSPVFSNDDLTTAVAGMERTRVALAMPKFEFQGDYTLKEALMSMGMLIPFSDDADFSGLSPTPLLIDKVLHKTFIAVDEFGTEAAAVTAIVMLPTSVETEKPPRPRLFKADHPFSFFIRHSDGNVLFAGRVGKPEPPESSKEPTFAADDAVWNGRFGTDPDRFGNSGTGASDSDSRIRTAVGPWLPLLLLLHCVRFGSFHFV